MGNAMLKPQIQRKELCGDNPEAFFQRGRKGSMFSLEMLFIPFQKGARPMKLQQPQQRLVKVITFGTKALRILFQIRLCELSDVELLNQKGQLLLKLQFCSKKSTVFLRKPEGLTDWYENILDNVQILKMKPMENSLSRSLIADSDIKKNPCSLRISQPNMGVSSLTYRKQNTLSK